MSNFYTEKQINDLRLAASYYKLDCSKEFWQTPAEELVKKCNGCGPERWSANKRGALTTALKRYEPCFAIHDCDYSNRVKQSEADKRLRRNMLKIWKKDFGVFRWLTRAGRAERLIVIPAVYAAVALGGKDAYDDAGEENEE